MDPTKEEDNDYTVYGADLFLGFIEREGKEKKNVMYLSQTSIKEIEWQTSVYYTEEESEESLLKK